MKVLVTGAGGFIGWHLANRLHSQGNDVYTVDIKLPQFAPCHAEHFQIMDLRLGSHVRQYFEDKGPFDEVYMLAADMGGIGYIEANRADIMRNNVLINCNTLHNAYKTKTKRLLFTSSACAYPVHIQTEDFHRVEEGKVFYALKESDVFPAMPEEGYGWEKLYTEMMCKYYTKEFDFSTRVVRLHNIYGPYGTYEGGREKAPAALCRKVAMSFDDQAIEIWGSGEQIRTFCYIDDCIKGLIKIMQSDYSKCPVNLGSDQPITIQKLAEMIIKISGKQTGGYVYNHNAATGVHGRSSDNTLLRHITGWSPQIGYKKGLAKTYEWIESEIQKRKELSHARKS